MTSLEPLFLDHVARLSRAYEGILVKENLDAIYLHSGVARPRSTFDDQVWPLRVVPHFAHWTPLVEADAVLELRAGHKPTLHRLVDGSFWEQPAPPPAHALLGFDVKSHATKDAMKAALPTRRSSFVGEDEASAAALGHTISTSATLLSAINETRVHKDTYDLHCLTEANHRAALGHAAVRAAFLDGAPRSELDLHLLYLGVTEQDDSDTPYKNIVALGEHAATLHHVSYGRERGPGATSLLLDAGVSYLGYASDITRTYTRGRSAELDGFAQLLDSVDELQQQLCSDVRAGQSYEALHDHAHELIGAALVDCKIVRGSADEAVSRGITRAFLPHGLGHSLGITTHDVGCALRKPRVENPYLRNTRDVEIGQVFTIEPGVYFIDGLLGPLRNGPNASLVDWSLVDALAPFGGIRIEDDLVVTAGKADNLTRAWL